MTKKVFLRLAVFWLFFLAVFYVIACMVCCQRASRCVENAIGAVYASNPEAAEQMLAALISGEKGDGIDAAVRLGLTDRTYGWVLQSIYPKEFILFMLTAFTLVFIVGIGIILLRKRRAAKENENLRRQVAAAIAEDAPIRGSDESSRLLSQLAEELKRERSLREKQAEELRIYTENVAHEIKTPAASLVLILDLMEADGLTSARLARARISTERIEHYVRQLLTLSRLRSGKLRLEREDFAVNDLLMQVKQDYPNVQLCLSESPIMVNADRKRLEEALRNLLANACKHDVSAPVLLSLQTLDAGIRIRISDRGKGLPLQIERYAVGKEDGTSTGIGLSLAAQIIEAHFGKLVFSEREGGGLNADILLPILPLKNSIM